MVMYFMYMYTRILTMYYQVVIISVQLAQFITVHLSKLIIKTISNFEILQTIINLIIIFDMYYQVVIILTQLTYLLLQHILNNKTQEPYDQIVQNTIINKQVNLLDILNVLLITK